MKAPIPIIAHQPRSFGRRVGRPLTAHKQNLVATLLPQLTVTLGDGPLDPAKLFLATPKDIWLEIGFGGGEHLAAQAIAHPGTGFIGCEPFRNGIASLLTHLDKQPSKNVRIFPDDARLLLDKLPDNAIARCFVLFPDPWPKKRHIERRFLGGENLARLARVLQPGAELRFASDDPGLQIWVPEQLAAHPDFKAAPGTTHGRYAGKPTDWPATRYEQKALRKGARCLYFSYIRQ